ncbi:MAG: hypothetical protein NC120_08115 [Ruminococcus sp.]|nr:hypothetical protein [Ruminococcus sp.]
MKITAVVAASEREKTTVVNAVKERLPGTAPLHFDDCLFEREAEDFFQMYVRGFGCSCM